MRTTWQSIRGVIREIVGALDRGSAQGSLSTRLVVAFLVVIIGTTVAAGVPAYWFISTELEDQAWARVEDGMRVTQALLEAEKERLGNLASLAAQRPTLKDILVRSDDAALSAYLQTFRASTDLDMLIVYDPSGRVIAANGPPIIWPGLQAEPAVAYQALPSEEPSLAILATQPVHQDPTLESLGYVTTGVLLDEAFTRQLTTTTGLGHSVVLMGKRRASSLSRTLPSNDPDLQARITEGGGARRAAITVQGVRYYTALLPLDGGETNQTFMEIALPVGDVLAAERRAMLTLAVSTLLVAALGSTIGVIFSGRLTNPLRQLTKAAENISQGDLTTPIPIPKEPIEIATLASALEESRINTRRSLENLSRQKDWSDTLIRSIVEGIVTLDAQGHITSFSQGAERMTGWRWDEVRHRKADQVFRVLEGDPFTRQLPPPGGMRQIRVRGKRGKEMTLAVTGAELRSPESDAIQSAFVLRDITEEHSIQNLRSYFLANISHEFRTPLSAINASVELLLEDLQGLSAAEISELLNSIHLSVTGLQTLIDNLLESLSIEAGRFKVRKRPSDLNKVIFDAARVMRPLLDRRQQNLTLEIAADRSPISIDPTRLTQVLVNLLSNASKYSPAKQTIEVHVERVDDGLLRIAVLDRGPGIPTGDRENLFQRFVRLSTQDTAQYGIGLGLSVVKAIVEEHGGEVGVDERPGGGSIFWFTLPSSGEPG